MKKEAMFYKQLTGDAVRCDLCSHHCRIENNEFGFCTVRQNIDHTLFTHVYGVVAANHVDPVEKKPLYHFLPDTLAYSIGTVGCNFRCGFCQNWRISQATHQRDLQTDYGLPMPPGVVVEQARLNHCQSIAYTYTEPTIFFEYAYDTAQLAREAGMRNIFVTNGFMTEKPLEAIAPWLDAANVDLKSWRDDYYREHCSGRLGPVLQSIRYMKKLGIWVEITTLLIPGENDSQAELEGIAGFIAGVDVDMPWHISAFHPSYQFMDRRPTSAGMLEEARETGRRAGLRFVYSGNVPAINDTLCPRCGKTVIKRTGALTGAVPPVNGHCPSCGAGIAGIWL